MGTASLVLFAVGGALVGLTALLWGIGRHDARWKRIVREAWSEAARELKLERVRPQGGGHGIAGSIDGFEVEAHTDAQKAELIRVRLKSGGRISADLKIGAPKLWSGTVNAQPLYFGSQDFRKHVQVVGPWTEALAALGIDARTELAPFVGDGGRVEGGELEVVVEFHESPGDLVWAVRRMVKIARGLAVASVPEALRGNALNDPDPELRTRNLSALVEGWPDSKEALQALQGCLRDLNPGVRCFAASKLPGNPESRPALIDLVDNGGLEGAFRAKALQALVAAYPYPEVAPVVARALASAAVELRCAAIEAVGGAQDESHLGTLAQRASQKPEAREGESLAVALARLGGPRAEETLLKLLGHDSPEVQSEAAKALGAVGTIRAVEPLLQSAEGAAVGSVARDAVRSIQARLGDAGAGRLSVVDVVEAEGAVSLENPIPDEPDKA